MQQYKYCNNYISFSSSSKDFFTAIFSFYYFRVIQIKVNENLIYPLDFNVEDICLPELDQNLNITAYKYKNDGTKIVNSSTNYFEDNSPDYSFIILEVEFKDDDNEYFL